MKTTPTFAIVGHPNKGKSSIVSTLSQDSQVQISPRSGTTSQNHSYPMQVDGEELYRLIDTPGFQRARAALEWMQQRSQSTADHSQIIEQFIEAHKDEKYFEAECQLLTPIMAGAGILYVVDGSIPYGAEYDAEIEILRWTGQPSMALINQISAGQFIEDWQRPLSQAFKIVRLFNAQTASFDQQLQLLSGFAELSEAWHEPLNTATSLLKSQRTEQIHQASLLIAEMLVKMTSQSDTTSLKDPKDEAAKNKMIDRFKESLKQTEFKTRQEIEQLFNYPKLQRAEMQMSILPDDLFSERTWKLFGLSRDQLVTAGIISGAAGGSMVDMGSGGLTLFLGSGIGAVVGGASAWLGGQQLIGTKLLGLSVGRNQIVLGPINNMNFPWVVLGRALVHLQAVCQRTHAQRDPLNLAAPQTPNLTDTLSKTQRKTLEKIFTKARKQRTIKPTELSTIAELITLTITEAVSERH